MQSYTYKENVSICSIVIRVVVTYSVFWLTLSLSLSIRLSIYLSLSLFLSFFHFPCINVVQIDLELPSKPNEVR